MPYYCYMFLLSIFLCCTLFSSSFLEIIDNQNIDENEPVLIFPDTHQDPDEENIKVIILETHEFEPDFDDEEDIQAKDLIIAECKMEEYMQDRKNHHQIYEKLLNALHNLAINQGFITIENISLLEKNNIEQELCKEYVLEQLAKQSKREDYIKNISDSLHISSACISFLQEHSDPCTFFMQSMQIYINTYALIDKNCIASITQAKSQGLKIAQYMHQQAEIFHIKKTQAHEIAHACVQKRLQQFNFGITKSEKNYAKKLLHMIH